MDQEKSERFIKRRANRVGNEGRCCLLGYRKGVNGYRVRKNTNGPVEGDVVARSPQGAINAIRADAADMFVL